MPAILLAFANDWIDDKRHLRSLLDESKAIGKALTHAVKSGIDVLPPLHNATIGDVIEAFRAHHDQIRIFHFGGHASSSMLLFEDETGHPAQAHTNGLASYLGEQPGLVLVFLNGCCTEPQMRRLRAAGVKAVVATTQAIHDAAAAQLAEAFYAELAVRSLRSAFDTAVDALRVRWGDDPRAVTRDVVPHDEPRTPSWPWVIDCDPAYEDWTLGAELAPQRNRAGWKRFGLAAAVLLLFSLLLIVLGFYLVPAPAQQFDVTIFLHGEAGQQAMVLRNSGKLALGLGADKRIESVGDKGEVRFAGIPAHMRGREVALGLVDDKYELVEPSAKLRLNQEVFYVAVRPQRLRLAGYVSDERGRPLAQARVSISGSAATTDQDGRFEIMLPADLPEGDRTVMIMASGYETWRAQATPGGNPLQVRLSASIGGK